MAKRKTVLGIPKCGHATSCGSSSAPDCSLSEWSDRITFRSSQKGEVILRVPSFDEFGEKCATNHIVNMRLARRMLVELATAIEEEANTKPTGQAAHDAP